MKREYHIIGTILYLLLFTLIFKEITISIMWISIIYGIASDLDNLNVKWFKTHITHRHWLFHSIIVPIIVFLFNPHILMLMPITAIGFHCLLDCRYNRSKQRGYYTIKLFRGYGLDGFKSTIWLLLNYTISLIITIFWCLR